MGKQAEQGHMYKSTSEVKHTEFAHNIEQKYRLSSTYFYKQNCSRFHINVDSLS